MVHVFLNPNLHFTDALLFKKLTPKLFLLRFPNIGYIHLIESSNNLLSHIYGLSRAEIQKNGL